MHFQPGTHPASKKENWERGGHRARLQRCRDRSAVAEGGCAADYGRGLSSMCWRPNPSVHSEHAKHRDTQTREWMPDGPLTLSGTTILK